MHPHAQTLTVPEGIDVFSARGRRSLAGLRTSAGFVLPFWKPATMSSSFYAGQVRWRLSRIHRVKRFKLGHAGTLDPFAEGVLILLGGKATALQETAIRQAKSYRATMRLGATTPSLDPATETAVVDPGFTASPNALQSAIDGMIGEVMQMPPSYSAKKIAGRRAYDFAIRGQTPELVPAPVRIDEMTVAAFDGQNATLDIRCGSGCYIRAIARDIAAALGTVGYLTALSRTQCGGFERGDCWDFPDILKELHVDPALAAPRGPKLETPISETKSLD